jgi:methionyl-tRNA formyltransferase
MRIYLALADEPAFHPRMLREIVLARPGEVVGVSIVSHRSRKQSGIRYLRKHVRFWGARGALQIGTSLVARRMLSRLPLTPAIAGYHSIRAVCREYSIDCATAADVNGPDHLARLRALAPDVIVSSQGQIFGVDLLTLPPLGCINRHSALLPRYRGMRPVFWALHKGEQEVGVSVHRMEPAIDAGEVLARCRVPVRSGASLYDMYADVFDVSAHAILLALEVVEGKRAPVPPEDQPSSYYRIPKRSDVAAFRKRRRMV